jgi:hypothetical protein
VTDQPLSDHTEAALVRMENRKLRRELAEVTAERDELIARQARSHARRCDWPTDNGRGDYAQVCPTPPTHRYRSPAMVDGHWEYRCEAHAAILNAAGLIVEPL